MSRYFEIADRDMTEVYNQQNGFGQQMGFNQQNGFGQNGFAQQNQNGFNQPVNQGFGDQQFQQASIQMQQAPMQQAPMQMQQAPMQQAPMQQAPMQMQQAPVQEYQNTTQVKWDIPAEFVPKSLNGCFVEIRAAMDLTIPTFARMNGTSIDQSINSITDKLNSMFDRVNQTQTVKQAEQAAQNIAIKVPTGLKVHMNRDEILVIRGTPINYSRGIVLIDSQIAIDNDTIVISVYNFTNQAQTIHKGDVIALGTFQKVETSLDDIDGVTLDKHI